jgi:hypothetical protein
MARVAGLICALCLCFSGLGYGAAVKAAGLCSGLPPQELVLVQAQGKCLPQNYEATDVTMNTADFSCHFTSQPNMRMEKVGTSDGSSVDLYVTRDECSKLIGAP